MRIEILVFPGVDELDALAPVEVLRTAAHLGADFQVRLVSLNGSEDIRGNHGMRFGIDGALSSNGRPDLLIVPGGGWAVRAENGAWGEARRGAIPTAIADLYHSGTMLASVCTGAMLLGAAGLLAGRRAITHHSAVAELRNLCAEVVSARVVDDGNIISAGGVTAGLDLALYLVERFAGVKIAEQCAHALEYERRGPEYVSGRSNRNAEGQAAS